MNKRPGLPMVAAFDMLCALLLIFTILAITQHPKANSPRIETLGQLAIVDTWRPGSNDDVDIYVRDPRGDIVWFDNQDAGLMHLEYDDLGTAISGTVNGVRVLENSERVLIRGAIPGEYTVNLHLYRKSDREPQHVKVQLWRLRGNDKALLTREAVLRYEGQEVTVFRFTLDANANASHFNTLPRRFISKAQFAPGKSTPPSGFSG